MTTREEADLRAELRRAACVLRSWSRKRDRLPFGANRHGNNAVVLAWAAACAEADRVCSKAREVGLGRLIREYGL